MDGVIVDFHQAIVDKFKIPESTIHEAAKPLGWTWVYDLTGLGEKQFWSEIDNIGFWEYLPWTHDGEHILDLVEKYFHPRNVCLLTNPSGLENVVIGKMRWIRREIPDYNNRVLFGAAKHFCAHPGRLLLDDAEHNIAAYEEAGGSVLLVPRLWNHKHEQHKNVPQHIEEWFKK